MAENHSLDTGSDASSSTHGARGRDRVGSLRWGRLLRWLRLPVLAYLVVLLILMLFERSFIFHPSPYPAGDWTTAGPAFEDAQFRTADNVGLHGWFWEHPQPQAVVLVAHGNAGNVTHRVGLMHDLHRCGASVLVFDYRGYGRSDRAPAPDEAGILADARAARRWLAQRTGIEERQIVLMGESLGGGVVVDLAANDGARGLILLNTFSSLADVAAWHFPWVPVRWLLRTRLDSQAKIGRYQGPLLQIHGDDDRIVPFALAQRLQAAAGEPKQLIVVPGGDHNDPLTPAALAAIQQFLAEL